MPRVFNPTMVGSFAALFSCTAAVVQVSDSMTSSIFFNLTDRRKLDRTSSRGRPPGPDSGYLAVCVCVLPILFFIFKTVKVRQLPLTQDQ